MSSPTCASDGPPFCNLIRGTHAISSVASAWLSAPTFAAGSLAPSTSTTFVTCPQTSPLTMTLTVTDPDAPGPRDTGPSHRTAAWGTPPGSGMELVTVQASPANVGN